MIIMKIGFTSWTFERDLRSAHSQQNTFWNFVPRDSGLQFRQLWKKRKYKSFKNNRDFALTGYKIL